MQPDKLRENAAKSAEEAKKDLESITRVGPGFEKRWSDPLRRSVSEKVEQASQKVMEDVQNELQWIIEPQNTDNPKEIWVYAAFFNERHLYFLSAARMFKQTAWITAANMYSQRKIMHLPVNLFEILIDKLKTSILAGDLDEHLHLTAEHLIYDRMKEVYDDDHTQTFFKSLEAPSPASTEVGNL